MRIKFVNGNGLDPDALHLHGLRRCTGTQQSRLILVLERIATTTDSFTASVWLIRVLASARLCWNAADLIITARSLFYSFHIGNCRSKKKPRPDLLLVGTGFVYATWMSWSLQDWCRIPQHSRSVAKHQRTSRVTSSSSKAGMFEIKQGRRANMRHRSMRILISSPCWPSNVIPMCNSLEFRKVADSPDRHP
nr:hypothetical protein CFP56_24475 [Quercus suber]